MSSRTRRPGGTSSDNEHVVEASSGTTTENATPSNQDVVLYLTLNNTTHKQDELPEALAALDAAEEEGLGDRDLLPISDPYATKHADGSVTYDDDTYKYSLGEEGADRIEWWHGDDELKPGQVRVNGEILSLGTDNIDAKDAKQVEEVHDAWRKTLAASGMEQEYIDSSIKALMEDANGDFKKLGSGDGATNELVQYMMAMYRAEKGEINASQIVFSGHHWRGNDESGDTEDNRFGGHGIWGEKPGTDHDYDNESDFFSLVDVGNLKEAFPTAYGQVKSVQLAACNTDALGITDEDGNLMTTNEFLQDTFSNIEMSSYWKETLAPLAASGFASNGEFILDGMRHENGDEDAIRDSRYNPKGLKRSILNEDGELEEISMKTSRSSYGASKSTGLKGNSNADFDEREDLADEIYTAETLDEVTYDESKDLELDAGESAKGSANAGNGWWDFLLNW